MSYASAVKTGEGQFQTQIQTGTHSFHMDEPAVAGGLDSGPNPFDLLCSALAGCTLMTLKLYADRKGWALDQLKVRVTHYKETAEAKHRFECIIELGDVTSEQRDRLLSIARRCPVHLTLEGGAEVPTTVDPDEPWRVLAA